MLESGQWGEHSSCKSIQSHISHRNRVSTKIHGSHYLPPFMWINWIYLLVLVVIATHPYIKSPWPHYQIPEEFLLQKYDVSLGLSIDQSVILQVAIQSFLLLHIRRAIMLFTSRVNHPVYTLPMTREPVIKISRYHDNHDDNNSKIIYSLAWLITELFHYLLPIIMQPQSCCYTF